MSHDFSMRDWTDDSDFMLPMICAEFPRISEKYTSFEKSEKRPWGEKSKPIYYDPFLDENLLGLNEEKPYQQGVWYYTGYPLTDHHDFAGLPNIWRGIQTLLGLEYRPQFYINIYNRIRTLDFTGPLDNPISIIQEEYIKQHSKAQPDLKSNQANSDFSLTDYLEYEIES